MAGESINAAEFRALFTRLDAIRQNHYNAAGQTAAGKTALTSAFTTSDPVEGVKCFPSIIQQVKDDLNVLANSVWLDNSFANSITIPSAGILMKRSNTYGIVNNTITQLEGICPNYSQYSQYSQNSQYHDYSDYGDGYGAYSDSDYSYDYGDGWW